jgi:hypothetical protein
MGESSAARAPQPYDVRHAAAPASIAAMRTLRRLAFTEKPFQRADGPNIREGLNWKQFFKQFFSDTVFPRNDETAARVNTGTTRRVPARYRGG